MSSQFVALRFFAWTATCASLHGPPPNIEWINSFKETFRRATNLLFVDIVSASVLLVILSQCCCCAKKKKLEPKKFADADDSKYSTLGGLNSNIFVQNRRRSAAQTAGLTQMQQNLQKDSKFSVQMVPVPQQQMMTMGGGAMDGPTQTYFTSKNPASIAPTAQTPMSRGGQMQMLNMNDPNISIQVLPHQTGMPTPGAGGGTGNTVWIVVPEQNYGRRRR